MQKHVNLVDLVKSFPTNIFLQNLASIQRSLLKFNHLAEKSEKRTISNLSTKFRALYLPRCRSKCSLRSTGRRCGKRERPLPAFERPFESCYKHSQPRKLAPSYRTRRQLYNRQFPVLPLLSGPTGNHKLLHMP